MDSLRIEHFGISTDMLLFSEVGMPLTQHYRVYKGGLPHAVFRTDYRPLLRSPGCSGSPPETGCTSTPNSVRRLHRSSQPKRLFPEAVENGPFLTEQNPAEMVGETVIDCRPSLLPVSIPLSGLSPDTVSGARSCVSSRPSEETGQSIMNMYTNEITISRIIGFDWGEAGTDLEDEMPTPDSSPTRIVVPAIPPVGTADPFGQGDGFDMDLAKVMCDVSVLSPGYMVPEESGGTWIPGFVPVSEVVREEEGSCLRLLEEPLPPKAVTETTTPVATDLTLPTVPQTPDENVTVPVTEGARKTERAQMFVVEGTEGSPSSARCADTIGVGPDISREGPFDVCEADHEMGQSPMVLDSMAGCQYRMTSYEDREDLDPSYGIHLHDPRMMEYMGAPESA